MILFFFYILKLLAVSFSFIIFLQFIQWSDTYVFYLKCSFCCFYQWSRRESNILEAFIIRSFVFTDHIIFQFMRFFIFITEIVTHFGCLVKFSDYPEEKLKSSSFIKALIVLIVIVFDPSFFQIRLEVLLQLLSQKIFEMFHSPNNVLCYRMHLYRLVFP